MTFGQAVAEARKRADLTQRDLAARIKKEDGAPISPQYLNDLERDRRNAPSEWLLKQFAQELNLPEEYLTYLAGQIPRDLRDESYSPKQVEEAFKAFRRELRRS